MFPALRDAVGKTYEKNHGKPWGKGETMEETMVAQTKDVSTNSRSTKV